MAATTEGKLFAFEPDREWVGKVKHSSTGSIAYVVIIVKHEAHISDSETCVEEP